MNKDTKSIKKTQQLGYFDREKEYFRQKQRKIYKKVVYKEESESEPEIDELVHTLRGRRH